MSPLPSNASIPSAPIIIAGMHRSGTSVLTTILDELGLFVGRKLDSNHEATFFVHLNNWLLRQAGATWDRPEAFEDFLEYGDLVEARVRQLEHLLKTPRAIEFLGLRNYLTLGDIKYMSEPWGWKDPRNTFTLPLWLKIFPNAKLLVIHRHGVDVANSLATRADKISKSLGSTVKNQSRWLWRLPLSNNSFSRCRDTNEGVALWKSYTETADRYANQLGERALVLQYEAFLEQPVPHIEQVLNFIGVEADRAAVERAVTKLVASRAYSYRGNNVLRSLAERHQSDLSAFGYSA